MGSNNLNDLSAVGRETKKSISINFDKEKEQIRNSKEFKEFSFQDILKNNQKDEPEPDPEELNIVTVNDITIPNNLHDHKSSQGNRESCNANTLLEHKPNETKPIPEFNPDPNFELQNKEFNQEEPTTDSSKKKKHSPPAIKLTLA